MRCFLGRAARQSVPLRRRHPPLPPHTPRVCSPSPFVTSLLLRYKLHSSLVFQCPLRFPGIRFSPKNWSKATHGTSKPPQAPNFRCRRMSSLGKGRQSRTRYGTPKDSWTAIPDGIVMPALRNQAPPEPRRHATRRMPVALHTRRSDGLLLLPCYAAALWDNRSRSLILRSCPLRIIAPRHPGSPDEGRGSPPNPDGPEGQAGLGPPSYSGSRDVVPGGCPLLPRAPVFSPAALFASLGGAVVRVWETAACFKSAAGGRGVLGFVPPLLPQSPGRRASRSLAPAPVPPPSAAQPDR